jgi:hypothetical protein
MRFEAVLRPGYLDSSHSAATVRYLVPAGRSRKDLLLFPLFFFRVRVVTLLELSSRRGLFPVGVIERPSRPGELHPEAMESCRLPSRSSSSSGCPLTLKDLDASEKRKRIFKAYGGLFVRCRGEVCRRRQREMEWLSPALPTSARMSPPPGYPSAMVASLQCPLPFHLVSLFRFPAQRIMSWHATELGVRKEVGASSRSRSAASLEGAAGERVPNDPRDA